MKLTYRGIRYQMTSPEVKAGPVFATGQFRGVAVGFRRPQSLPIKQPILQLKYRNIAYTTGVAEPAPSIAKPAASPIASAAPTQPIAAPQPAEPAAAATLDIQDRARVLLMQHHAKVTRREEGMLSRLFSEIGMPAETANHHASRIQGKIHSEYWTTYDRSHAAMS